MNKLNFYIFTGGPGAGKTSLLNELEARGYQCIPEVARTIIQEQVSDAGDALPWADTGKYAELMLIRSIRDFRGNSTLTTPCLFDRGIPDTLAYCTLVGQEMNKELVNEALSYRYNPIVFILPPWQEIYHTDSERKQDFQLAVETFRRIEETYSMLGYELIQVPRLPVSQRADFVWDILKNNRKADTHADSIHSGELFKEESLT